MRSILVALVLSGGLSGCLFEPARTRSSAGWTISYTRPPIVDVTTPVLLDRAAGELDGLTAQPELSLGRSRSTFRTRSTLPTGFAEPLPLGLPAPVPIAVATPPVPAIPLAAPLCPPPVLAGPPPTIRESVVSTATLQQVLDRLAAIEAKLPAK